LVDWPKFKEQYAPAAVPLFLSEVTSKSQPQKTAEARPKGKPSLMQQLEKAPSERRGHLLRGYVQNQVRRVLRDETSDSIDPDKPLFEMGFDSLMALELRNGLGKELERNLPATLLFDYPTVHAIADFLLGEVLAALSPAAPETETQGADEPATEPPTDLDNLADEEMADLLARKLATLAGEKSAYE
jgi:polyketide synthase 12/myxalamid-type polyketide synthase MxaB